MKERSALLHRLSPYIRIAMDSVIPFPWHMQERTLFDYELLFVKEGEIVVTVEDIEYRGIPGDFFLFKPAQRHSIRIAEGHARFRQPHLHFDLIYRPDSEEVKVSFHMPDRMTEQEKIWFRRDDSSAEPMKLPNHIRLANPAYMEKLLFDIIREFNMKHPYYETAVKGLFIQLWTQLLREHHLIRHEPVALHWDRLERIRQHLHREAERDISLQALAESTNLSKYHLIRLFKLAFGATPMQYHQKVRIGKAREAVQFTNEPLTTLAERFGYPNIHSFSRAFKKVEGVPPSFYRKKI